MSARLEQMVVLSDCFKVCVFSYKETQNVPVRWSSDALLKKEKAANNFACDGFKTLLVVVQGHSPTKVDARWGNKLNSAERSSNLAA